MAANGRLVGEITRSENPVPVAKNYPIVCLPPPRQSLPSVTNRPGFTGFDSTFSASVYRDTAFPTEDPFLALRFLMTFENFHSFFDCSIFLAAVPEPGSVANLVTTQIRWLVMQVRPSVARTSRGHRDREPATGSQNSSASTMHTSAACEADALLNVAAPSRCQTTALVASVVLPSTPPAGDGQPHWPRPLQSVVNGLQVRTHCHLIGGLSIGVKHRCLVHGIAIRSCYCNHEV